MIIPISIYSQEAKQDSIYSNVDVMPEYPDGGIKGFSEFIFKNFRTRKIKNNINGTIYVQFVVETDGSISEIKCIKDLGYGTCEEAIRVIKKSKKWIPGIQKGRPVRVHYTLPLNFIIKNKYLAN